MCGTSIPLCQQNFDRQFPEFIGFLRALAREEISVSLNRIATLVIADIDTHALEPLTQSREAMPRKISRHGRHLSTEPGNTAIG
jgi:hypothetical protein